MYLAYCKKEIKINVILNLLINGAIGWFMFASMDAIPLTGEGDTVAFDLGLGTFFVTFFVCFFTMFNIQQALKKNSQTGHLWEEGTISYKLASMLPATKAKLVTLWLVVAFTLFYAPSLLVVEHFMDGAMGGVVYTVYKTLYCTVLAYLIAFSASRVAVADHTAMNTVTATA
ncbi:hypothetical protein EOPP23_09135 [Endozoicomonas sp. OPT23]|uniref:hypothetical protein n=1 Tax=Endozoicomonas sp. OPT23 TaxID=2072845 RepID=UPI00129A6FD9|nr:hypothetical protein [Endozoicomonas sp. OPT23]MRI33145.1 hypothetical protein [Endozoicomonas sp. OPT23]